MAYIEIDYCTINKQWEATCQGAHLTHSTDLSDLLSDLESWGDEMQEDNQDYKDCNKC